MNNVQINKLNKTENVIKEKNAHIVKWARERIEHKRMIETLDTMIIEYKKSIINPLKTERNFLKREGRIANLLVSIRDIPAPCGMKLNSELRVKTVFQGPLCNGETCPLFDCCAEIVSISSIETPSPKLLKGKAKKVIKKSATSSTGSRVHKTKKTYDKSSETVSIVFTETGETFTFNVSDGIDAYKADLEKTFPKSFFEGRTDGTTKSGCFAGFKHETFTKKFTNQ